MRVTHFYKTAFLCVVMLSLAGQSVFAQQDQKVDDAVNTYLAEITQLRHTIHQNPELGNREFETAKMVAAHLRKLGIEVTTEVAHTGVVGILKGGKPGPVVGVRADMDALPVTEDTDFPFKSTVRTTYLGKDVGVMHACGHDVHTAVQMGVASVLASMKDDLPGTVKFIFQPAEEGAPAGEGGGARMMIAQGTMDNPRPSAVFGLHTWATMDIGTIGFTSGPAMASSDGFTIKIIGKQAHGAQPHMSVDPVVTASQVVLGLQTIRSRNLNPLEANVITVGIIRGGERSNIIPAEVELRGTVRTFNPDVQDIIERRMEEVVKKITESAGATYTFRYGRGYPPTINNPELVAQMLPTIQRVIGNENTIAIPPTMGAEDFSMFANISPGFFFFLGSSNPEKPSGGHHTPTFRADDSSIKTGMRVMTNVLLDYLRSGSN